MTTNEQPAAPPLSAEEYLQNELHYYQYSGKVLKKTQAWADSVAAHARAQTLREMADMLDATAQECLVSDADYDSYETWINARNVVLLMMPQPAERQS